MADETVTELATLELPFRRKASVRLAEFESGMKMVRLVLREGTRITQVDLDGDSAGQLAGMLLEGAKVASEEAEQ